MKMLSHYSERVFVETRLQVSYPSYVVTNLNHAWSWSSWWLKLIYFQLSLVYVGTLICHIWKIYMVIIIPIVNFRYFRFYQSRFHVSTAIAQQRGTIRITVRERKCLYIMLHMARTQMIFSWNMKIVLETLKRFWDSNS